MTNNSDTNTGVGLAIACGIVTLVSTFLLWNLKGWYYKILIIIIIYIISFIINLYLAWFNCGSISSISNVAIRSTIPVGSTILGFGIGYIPICRKLVISALGPFLTDNMNYLKEALQPSNNDDTETPTPKNNSRIETPQETIKTVRMIPYAFYGFFATIYGVLGSNGFLSLC